MEYPYGSAEGDIIYDWGPTFQGYIHAGDSTNQMHIVIDESGGYSDPKYVYYDLEPGNVPYLVEQEGANVPTFIAYFILADGTHQELQHWLFGELSTTPTIHEMQVGETAGIGCDEYAHHCGSGGGAHADALPPYLYTNTICYNWNNVNDCLEAIFINHDICYENITPSEWQHFANAYSNECLSHDYWYPVYIPYIHTFIHTNTPYDDHCADRRYEWPNEVSEQLINRPTGEPENWEDIYPGETEDRTNTWIDAHYDSNPALDYHYQWTDQYQSHSEPVWEDNGVILWEIVTWHYANGLYDMHENTYTPAHTDKEWITPEDPRYPPHYCLINPVPPYPPGAQAGDGIMIIPQIHYLDDSPIYAYKPGPTATYAYLPSDRVYLAPGTTGPGVLIVEHPTNPPEGYDTSGARDGAPNLVYYGEEKWYICVYDEVNPTMEHWYGPLDLFPAAPDYNSYIYGDPAPGFINVPAVDETIPGPTEEAFYNIVHYYDESYCGDYSNWPNHIEGHEWNPFTNFCDHTDQGAGGAG